MNIVDVRQGTPKWLEVRAKHFTASEASAMMGDSKYMSRDHLLKQKHTGESEPVDDRMQALFDRGHATEKAIRPHIEKMIGLELYPATGTEDIEGLPLLSSFDGITMAEHIIFEHKLFNIKLAEQIKNEMLEPHYYWQLEQQLLVSGTDKVIFVTSDGTPDKMGFCWYVSIPERRKQLIAGWHQFKKDLGNYKFVPEPELVKPEAVLSLPAVSIKVDGTLALIDNLGVFGEALQGYIKGINKEPKNDQDFANLESAVKTLKTAEESLNAAENGALAQASDIDTMRRTVDLYRTMARDNRLIVEKLVKTQKEVIKNKIVTDAKTNLDEHIAKLNNGLGSNYLNNLSANFISAIKGKRTMTSLRGAANDELARVKIKLNESAEIIRTNLKTLNTLATEYKFLFNDLDSIIGKENSDFVLLVNARIAEHQKAEQEKAEAEKERILREERYQVEKQRLQDEADKKEQKDLEALQAGSIAALAPEEAEAVQSTPAEASTPEPDVTPTPVRYVKVTGPDAELKILLGKKISVEPNDFMMDEIIEILVWIGKGIEWSEDFHIDAVNLAKKVQLQINTDISASA